MAEEEGRFTNTPGAGSQVEAKTPASGTEGTNRRYYDKNTLKKKTKMEGAKGNPYQSGGRGVMLLGCAQRQGSTSQTITRIWINFRQGFTSRKVINKILFIAHGSPGRGRKRGSGESMWITRLQERGSRRKLST